MSQQSNQPVYIYAIVFAAIAMFVVWLLYKFLVPMFSIITSPLASQYPAMVGNDPTYVNGFNSILSNEHILFNYGFVVMALGIGSIFIIIFAYRSLFGSTAVTQEDGM